MSAHPLDPPQAEPSQAAQPPLPANQPSAPAPVQAQAAPPPAPVQPNGIRHTAPSHQGVVLGAPRRTPGRAAILASPLDPPDQPSRRLIRYDLLAGVALVLALLALVPLLLLRNDPEEISTSPKVPPANGVEPDTVVVELAEPTDLRSTVQLTWKATHDLDFAVIVAAEGLKPRALLAERKHSMTVDVEPERKYCFLVQASDGDQVYESEPQSLRGAVCQK
jgi:hypothetical protein